MKDLNQAGKLKMLMIGWMLFVLLAFGLFATKKSNAQYQAPVASYNFVAITPTGTITPNPQDNKGIYWVPAQQASSGSAVNTPVPTNTPTTTFTPTITSTCTTWVPLTKDQVLGSPTPTPAIIVTPITGKATGIIFDSIVESGTVQDNALLYLNGVLFNKIPLTAGGGILSPIYAADTSGNATWGLGTTSSASSTITYNYRLWIAPVGTPPPSPLR